MKKIMFNDTFGLTQAVLDGRKTMTRRWILQPPYENYDVAFPVPTVAFDEKSPLNGAFCWVNKDNRNKYTKWIRPQWRVGEVVAVAQSYQSVFDEADKKGYWNDEYADFWNTITHNHAGWKNKMFVKAELMPHQIQITDVTLQRLQDISDEDCLKEGVVEDIHHIGGAVIKKYHPSPEHVKAMHKIGWGRVYDTPQEAFAQLIDKVCCKETWDCNPYVFVYEFKLIG